MNIDMVYMYSIMCMYIPYSIYIHSVHVYIFLVDHWPMTFLLIFHFFFCIFFFVFVCLFICLLYIENNAKLDGTLQTVCITKSLWIFRSFCALESKSVKHMDFFFFMHMKTWTFFFFFYTSLNQSSFIGACVCSERRHWIFSQPWMFNSKHFDALFLGVLLLIDYKIHNRSALEFQP